MNKRLKRKKITRKKINKVLGLKSFSASKTVSYFQK